MLHIHNTDNVSDDLTLELEGAAEVTTAVVGGTTYLFVTGVFDDGVSVFAVAADGTLTNVDNVSDDATLAINGADGVTTAVVGGTTYLFVTGVFDDGVSVFAVADDGTLINVENVGDDATLELDGARGVTTAVVGGTTYLFVTGRDDDGVSVFAVADDGTLNNADNVTDDPTLELLAAAEVTTAVVGGTTYLFVSAPEDDGVSVFAVADDGTLTNVDNVTDDATLELLVAAEVTTAVVGGTTYLFVTGHEDDGVSVFAVADDGTLTNADNVTDGGRRELDGAASVTTAVVGGTTYLFVTGFDDDGVSVFAVADDGTLTNADNVGDDATLELDGAGGVTTAVVGGIVHLFVAGRDDNGVSAFAVDGNVPLPGDVLWQHSDGTVATGVRELGLAPAGFEIQGIGDFDGDGGSDIVWRDDDAGVLSWELENGEFAAEHSLPAAPHTWQIAGTGDFDGDGDDDIVWRHNEGAVTIWEMEAGDYVINHNQPDTAITWEVAGTGDFDGDGDDDIVWRDDDAGVLSWELENGEFAAEHSLPAAPHTWQIAGAGDFDGDGDDDIVWRHNEGAVTIWEMEDSAYVVNHNQPDAPPTGEIEGTHDFDNDGDADILWRQDDGQVIAWEIEDLNFIVAQNFGAVSNGWQIRGTGEFDLV